MNDVTPGETDSTNNARTELFTVEKSHPGERLDKFLCTRFPAVSRGAIQRLIEEGHILVNEPPTCGLPDEQTLRPCNSAAG